MGRRETSVHGKNLIIKDNYCVILIVKILIYESKLRCLTTSQALHLHFLMKFLWFCFAKIALEKTANKEGNCCVTLVVKILIYLLLCSFGGRIEDMLSGSN